MPSTQQLSLERSMNQFRRELTDDQQKDISGANRKVINHEIQKMQAKLGREKSLCRLSRIEKFLDAMEHIEKLVTIFLNVSEAVAFIWGPIKLVLMAATAWTNCIKKLLDVYEEVADTLDNLTFFQALIKSDERFSRTLEDYFSDILRFHRSILDFFSRPDWKARFQWVWGDFRRKIKPIMESLKRKQAMLSDDKLQPHAILKAIEDSDALARDQFKQINSGLESLIDTEDIRSQRLQEQEIKSLLERKLNVSLPQISSQREIPDTVVNSSGSWIFSDPLFQAWEADTSAEGSVLFLTGCPGAGKSTLARTIIHHFSKKRSQQSSSRHSLIYFFFRYNDADRRSTRSMLCHLITQIINTDDAMMRFAYDKCSSKDYLDLPFLKSLALDCLSSKRDTMIVLDGLDEGTDNEPQRVIKWCLDEILTAISSRGCHVKFLICGQEDGRIEPLLSSYPQIRLHTVDYHHMDIQEYCKTNAPAIATRFRLPPDDERALILKVTKASNGMFLYTKVVLANLLSMGSRKEFKAELASDRFPRNLDEAYGRIIQRVINPAEPSAQASAKKVLGLLVCSQRPLRWREIQSRFCIDADEALCDPDDLRADTCKQLCSSLVDTIECDIFPGVQSEQIITMVHETARKYLVYSKTINLMEEHISMSLFCCRYLSSSPYLASESTCIEKAVQSGYFSFMDYAAVYYQLHVQKADALKGNTDSDSTIDTAKEALTDLDEVYGTTKIAERSLSDANGKRIDLAMQAKVLAIRSITDKQRDVLSQNAGFLELEGPKRFKCSRLQCPKFSVGYPSEAALQTHLASHERPFRCRHESCFAHIFGYASEQALEGHNKAFHDESHSITTFPVGEKADKSDLINACRVGDLGSVKSLHLLGADLLHHSYKTSPLKVSLKAGHSHICKYLIDNGASPLETSEKRKLYQSSPLHLAVDKKDFHMLELFLLGYQGLMTEFSRPRLASCILDIFTSFPPAVELLLQLLAIAPSSHSQMMQTLMAEQLTVLLRHWGQEAPAEGKIITNHSIDTSSLHERLSQLFPRLYDQSGMFLHDPNLQEYKVCQRMLKESRLMLHNAFLQGQCRLSAFLMDIDNNNLLQVEHIIGNLPLHSFIVESCRVACNGCTAMTRRLVKQDGSRSANFANHEGKLPLHLALERGVSPEMLQILSESTENLNHKDGVGNSPLHYVRNEEGLTVLLQRKGLNLLSRNKKGQTIFTALCEKLLSSENGIDESILQSLLKVDRRLAWEADDSAQRFPPLHYANGMMGQHRLSSTLEVLLQLPEVEHILLAFLSTGVNGSVSLRTFARKKGLHQTLDVMDRLKFGYIPFGR